MEDKDFEEKVKKIIADTSCDNFIETICISLFGLLLVGIICYTYVLVKNSDFEESVYKSRNEQLSYCREVYSTDKVILSKCRNYFIELGDIDE